MGGNHPDVDHLQPVSLFLLWIPGPVCPRGDSRIYIFLQRKHLAGSAVTFFVQRTSGTALYLTTLPTPKGQKDLGEDFPWWLGVVSLVLIVYLFKEFKKTSLRQRAKVNDDDWPEDDFQNWAISPS